MNPIIYGITNLLGVALIALGVGAVFGWPYAAIAAGALAILLNLFAVKLAMGR